MKFKRLGGLLLLPALLALGCASDTVKPGNQPPALPNNDTPANAMLRFTAAYEQKRIIEYAAMFTKDFTFEFSNSTDPDLVAKYSTGWFKVDETESSSHLFQGYTPPGGSTLKAASSIDINFANATPVDDNGSGDPVTHKILITRVDGKIVIPPGQGETESTTFLIDNNQNAFYLVRGDQAAELDSDQPADDAHWYIYRWTDQTQGTGFASHVLTAPTTWAMIRSLYR